MPFAEPVHVLVHTQSDEGVVDHYVCRRCYEAELAPLFEWDGVPAVGSDGHGVPVIRTD